MTEYVERDAALNVNFRVNVNSFESRITTAKRAVQTYADEIAKLPAADVRPVVKARWTRQAVILGHPLEIFLCSACGGPAFQASPFCPTCGAEMEEQR